MNKSLLKIFPIYVFAYAFFSASRPISDGDFWFHLKTGEYIIRTGLIPRADLFSFTNYGRPWIAHGWLSGVVFYAVYSRLGFNALIFIFALLVALAFSIVFRRSDSHPFIAGFATLLGVWTVLPTVGVRPRVFTLLLSSVFLAILTRYARSGTGRAIWWLVPLMALWANLHGGYLIGLALIALTIVGIPLDAWAAGEKVQALWPRLRTLAIVMVGCVLAALLNPYGLRIYTFPIGVLLSPVFQGVVVDWLSPDFHQPESLPLLVLILLTIAALALSPKRVRPSELLFFLATLYATLKSQRHLVILAIVAVPLLADYLQSWLVSTSFGKAFGRAPSAHATTRPPILLILLLLLPLAAFAIKLKSTLFAPPRQEMVEVPLEAVEYLKENQITGNTFTDPNIWGGYVIWTLPNNPVYIDGRDVYPEAFVKEYVGIVSGQADWRGPFDRYSVRMAIVTPKSLLVRGLKESTAWQQVFQDDMAVVFVRQ